MTQSPPRSVGYLLIGGIIAATWLVIDSLALRIGLTAAAMATVIIGHFDERYDLKPHVQFMAQAGIAALLVLGGWTITRIANPFGSGFLDLTTLSTPSFIAPSIATVLWLIFLMNAINWFDGVDGLAAGVSAAAFAALALISLLPSTRDGSSLSLSLISLVATAIFLIWNWQPARVYLGTAGSWFLGLWIGALAIMGSGKVATTIIILAFPAADVFIVALRRLAAGIPPWRGDTSRHLHHRLLSRGWKPAHIAASLSLITVLLGISVVILQAYRKPIATSGCFDFGQAQVMVGEAVFRTALARTPAQQQRGLGGCRHMQDGQAMYFPVRPAARPAFWMKDMHFPIDIVWISDNQVISIEHNIAPPAANTLTLPVYHPPQPVDAVLEMNAGLAQELRIQSGSTVQVVLTNSSR